MNFQPGDVVRLKKPRTDIEASGEMTQYLHAITGKTGVIHAVGLDGTSVVAVFDYELDTLSRKTVLTGCLLWTEEIELVSRPAKDDAK